MPASQRPLKRFSQNFLTDPVIQEKITNALNVKNTDYVLEIGPGKGALSQHIVRKKPAHFWAVEIDTRWAAHLKDLFDSEIDVLRQDFLTLSLDTLYSKADGKIKAIGNLPYHITSPILFRLIDTYTFFDSSVLMAQKEVARRITAQPGNKDYGILSVVCQACAKVEYLFEVKPGSFFPAPAVDSAVFKLSFYKRIEGLHNEILFRKIVRSVFNTRRKMLRGSLGRTFEKSIVYSLSSDLLRRRPEELSVQEFITLTNKIDDLLKKARDEH